MHLKIKAFLLALAIPMLLFSSIYVLIYHIEYALIVIAIAVVFSLYKLILNILIEREKRK